MGGISARDFALLSAILILALAARVVGLNAPLWFDEIVTIDTHLRLPWSGMMQSYSMNHHYFFDLQAKALMQIWGEQPWALRLPAMLFGVAGIAAIWVLARDISGVGLAHLTALLLAVSYHHIWFSQNARGYTELAFWCTVGLICFLRGLHDPRWGLWLGFGLSLTAATYTHLTGAFFFASLGVVWLLALWRQPDGRLVWRPLLAAALGFLLLVALYAPLIPSLRETVGAVSTTSALDVMQEYQNPIWTVFEAVRTGVGGAGLPVVGLAVLVLGLTVVGGFVADSSEPWFAPAILLHILLTMGILMALGMRIWPRFFFVDIGFLMLLIVLGVWGVCSWLVRLFGWRTWAEGLFILGAVGMVALSCLLALRNYGAPKQDLAGAVALVETSRQPGERVYAIGPAAELFVTHFGVNWQAILDDDGYRAAIAEPGPAWFVVAFPGRSFRRVSLMEADVGTVLTEIKWFPGTLGDGAVAVLERK